MSAEIEFSQLPPIPEIESEPKQKVIDESLLDWRGALSRGLNPRSVEAQRFDKIWASFCDEIRSHCPETDWVFITSATPSNSEPKELETFEAWIKSMVAQPTWPFPERVIILAGEKGQDYHWRIAIPGDKKLPKIAPPLNFSVQAWSESSAQGLELTVEQTFIIDRAGNA